MILASDIKGGTRPEGVSAGVLLVYTSTLKMEAV
jgi:hypothetical protein